MPTAVATDRRELHVALIGNPNSGKSSLFNALAGMHARVGNYPGVTVEKKIGRVRWHGQAVSLIDLPGTYSLAAKSLDEMVAVDVLLGRRSDVERLDVIVCIVDASHLNRHLYLLSQLLDLAVPVVLVLNMWDVAERCGHSIDVAMLSERLGVPVVASQAHRRIGIEQVRQAIVESANRDPAPAPRVFPEAFSREADRLAETLAGYGIAEAPLLMRERLLLESGGTREQQLVVQAGSQLADDLAAARQRIEDAGHAISSLEVTCRYEWVRGVLTGCVTQPPEPKISLTDRIDRVLTHRIGGFVILVAVMLAIFQALYTWAAPLMTWCEAGPEWLAGIVESSLAPGSLRSLIVDGVLAGVGAVLVFLPQIAMLFLFIAILEDCGYMARAAYMMDRLMAPLGLSGHSFLPLMSSFACAVPGIMATRVIGSHRERMVTILIAPLMSCSARLPVYLLLISAFVPQERYLGGWVSLQGLVLFAMSSLRLVIAVPVAWILRRSVFPGASAGFLMELPEYKVPTARLVLHRVYDRSKAFALRAGTLIFATTILVWAAGYFPGDHAELNAIESQIAELASGGTDDAPELTALRDERNRQSAALLRGSLLGRAGQAIEPVVKPLGWDWKIGVGVLASFPAREVIISTMGTIYSLGGDVDEESVGLAAAVKEAEWPDGRPVYNIPVALSLMVFFALCAQCASTLMIIWRETNSWRWPLVCFAYMTGLGYIGALLTYQIGMLMTGA